MKRKNNGLLLALPALAGFMGFYFIPFLITVWYSLSFGIGRREFVGLDNFRELFQNEMFQLAIWNTCKYILVTIPVTLGIAIFLAVLLQTTIRGVKFFQLSFLYPLILPIASVVLAIQFLWGDNGIWNRLLEMLGKNRVEWLDSSWVFWILCLLYVWRFTGYYILIYLARIQMIPKEYYEYASLFGASKGAKFRYITWPILLPTFLFTIVLAVMNAFKCYREAFLLGGNYPNESIYLLQHFMNNNFQNMNYQKISAAAVSIVVGLLIVIALCYAGYAWIRRKR